MKNITKIKVWPALQALGFERITYSFNGKVITIGASLRRKLKDISGKDFFNDIITIQPQDFQYSKECYHISGEVKTPYYDTFYRIEQGRKIPFIEQVTNLSTHVKAGDIMKIVSLMLK